MPLNLRGSANIFTGALQQQLQDKAQRRRDEEEERRRREEEERRKGYEQKIHERGRTEKLADITSEREYESGREDIATGKKAETDQFMLDDEFRALKTHAETKGYTIPEPPGGIVTKSFLDYQELGYSDFMDARDKEEEEKVWKERQDYTQTLRDKPEPEKKGDTSGIENVIKSEINRIVGSKSTGGETPIYQNQVNSFMEMQNDPYIQELWDMLADQNPEAYESLYAEFMRLWGNTRQLSRQGTGGLYPPEQTRDIAPPRPRAPSTQIRW